MLSGETTHTLPRSTKLSSLPVRYVSRIEFLCLCPQASLAECNIQNIKEEVVHMLVTVALEESASRRELASVLISDLYGYSVINLRDVTEGELPTQTHANTCNSCIQS